MCATDFTEQQRRHASRFCVACTFRKVLLRAQRVSQSPARANTGSWRAPHERDAVQEEHAQVQRHKAVVEHRSGWPQLPPVELHVRVVGHQLLPQMPDSVVLDNQRQERHRGKIVQRPERQLVHQHLRAHAPSTDRSELVSTQTSERQFAP